MSRMDYYSILAPAVAALNPNTPQNRAAVYNHARKLVSDRTAGAATASDELLALENAIRRVEDEFAVQAPPEPETWDEPAAEAEIGPIDVEPQGSSFPWTAIVAV